MGNVISFALDILKPLHTIFSTSYLTIEVDMLATSSLIQLSPVSLFIMYRLQFSIGRPKVGVGCMLDFIINRMC